MLSQVVESMVSESLVAGDINVATPLFYRRVVPLDSVSHRRVNLAVPDRPLGYARGANVIPALLDEFVPAAGEMPIAFIPGADHPSAVFVTGLRPGSNLFIDEAGHWVGAYVPAYLRRYPFIIGDVPNGQPILCMDADYEGFNETSGTPLFAEDGKPSEAVTQALALAQSYKAAAERTDRVSKRLRELGLFRSVTLDARLASGQTTVVHGLLIVDEEVLEALPADQLAELHAEKLLKPIYAHLLSLGTLSRLGEREQKEQGVAGAAA